MTPTVSVGGINWTFVSARQVVEGGAMPDGSTATQADQLAADQALATMEANGALYGVPGAVTAATNYNWPSTPPAAPPPHQAAGAQAAIAVSGISPLTPMGGESEATAYTSYLQQLDNWNWINPSNLTGWNQFSLNYKNAMNAFNNTTAYPPVPANPVYRIGANFAVYHAAWIKPLEPPASPDIPGGAEPLYTTVTAQTVSTFDYSAATIAKHKALSQPEGSIAAPASTIPAQPVAPSGVSVASLASLTPAQKAALIAFLQA